MASKPQRLRIIGGTHRSRVLDFMPAEGLRPTPDRVRETVFNWLQPIIDGASCLDLFSGSGALGLEAASRGAARVVMIEPDRNSAGQIREHIDALKLSDAVVLETKAENYIPQDKEQFDIVFIDPPYHTGLLYPTCCLLEEYNRLKLHARIYLESESPIETSKLPENWDITHQKQAGQVFYHLATRG